MKRWRNYFMTKLLLCISPLLYAQWDVPASQYWEINSYYNPSFAGETNSLRVSALYVNQWTNTEEAPQKIIFTANMPLEFMNRRHGVGLSVFTENIGTLRNSLVAVQYSFIQPFENGTLNIGLQAGLYNLNYDAGTLRYTTDSLQNNRHRVITNTTEKQLPDFSAGLSWTTNNFYAGLSIMHLNQPSFYTVPNMYNDNILDDSIKTSIPRTYYFTARYNISIFNTFEIQPMVGILFNDNQTYSQATVRLEYDNKFSGGFSYISEYGHTLFAGTIIRGVQLGYAYTKHKIGIEKKSHGSHELFIKYDFPLDYFRPKSQPHKSIRLL